MRGASGAAYGCSASFDFNDGTWHNLAVAFDSSSVSVYLDGTLAGTGTLGAAPGASSGIRFGCSLDGLSSTFKGALDEWRIAPGTFDAAHFAAEAVADGAVSWDSGDVKTATETTPVPVPYAELRESYSSYLAAADGDYEAAAWSTGVNGYKIWECYLAGLDPDVADSKFRALIEMTTVEGEQVPVITWEPDLGDARIYTILGKESLQGEEDWTPVADGETKLYNFFKVEVKMK